MIDRPLLSSRALQVAAVAFALVPGIGLSEAGGTGIWGAAIFWISSIGRRLSPSTIW